MPTQRQLEANRINAQRSTGPTTEEGRCASSRNALKSGLDAKSQLLPGESPEEFAQLQSEYYDFYAPATPFERAQLDNFLRNEWNLRRLFRIEAQLWGHHARQAERGTGVELAEGYDRNQTSFNRLWRRKKECEKAQLVAIAEFERLTRLRTAAPAPEAHSSTSQPQQTVAETRKLASFRTSSQAPAPAPLTDAEIAEFEALRQKIAPTGHPAPLPLPVWKRS